MLRFWFPVIAAAAIAAGCEDSAAVDDATLPETGVGEPDGNSRFEQEDSQTGGAVLDTATSAPDVPPVLDLGPIADNAGNADGGQSEAIGTSETTDDGQTGADGGPQTKPVVTTCEGHCGIYMEDNPCHCSVLCLGEGNCCAGFAQICKCGKDGDCDDGNDCTSDSCNKTNGYCFQQPMKACCQKDSECPAGDDCNTAKCISGTCTKQPKDCNDNIDCTLDYCDKGACVNKINTKNCLIDGKCLKAGDQDPISSGCATCDPAKKQDNWTALPGKCAIDGDCVSSGAVNPAAVCAVCDTTKSTTAWSTKATTCYIDGKCYKSGEPNPASICQVCDPTAISSVWSGKSGFCAIDGQCIADKAVNPTDACQLCDVSKNKAGWTAKVGFCALDGQCVANGKAAEGSGGCKVCDASKPTGWTLKTAGSVCTSAGPCLTTPKCDDAGQCAGVKKPGCCQTDDDCANDPSAAPGVCETAACAMTTGKCALKAKVDCCLDGVCCDKGSNTLKPAGTACSTFVVGNKYACEGEIGYKIAQVYGCTGTSPTKCSSSMLADGDKTVVKKCADTENCVQSTPTSLICKPK